MNHNKIKTIASGLLFALILTCLNTSCTKNKITQVTNNKELEQMFYGEWALNTRATVELYTDPDTENQKYYGKADILSSNVMSFSENQVYSMKVSSTVEELRLTDNALGFEDELTAQLENTILIQGTFSVDTDYLELTGQTVVVNNSATYSAKEYAQIDSRYGAEKQIVKWNLIDDTLEISDLNANTIVTYNKL